MSSYNAPGVFIQDISSGAQSIEQASSSVGILIGVTKSGLANVAQKIGSWLIKDNKTNWILPMGILLESE